MGVKGWWESDNVFVIHRDEIVRIRQERISVIFEDDQVTLQTPDATLVGRLAE
jgi:hypothetical protein